MVDDTLGCRRAPLDTPAGLKRGARTDIEAGRRRRPGQACRQEVHMPLTRAQTITSWILQLVAAGILFQTLFFKFTAAEESVYIFRTLGAEPWGRLGSGAIELVAVILLVVPGTAAMGAALSTAVISGAIASHLLFLGIEVKGDGGLLFGLAVVVFVASIGILVIRRHELPIVGTRVAAFEHTAR
jgi:hypothetical protein